MASTTDTARLQQGPGAIYSVHRACQLLPWGEKRSKAFLYRHGLVRRDAQLGLVVSWREVLEAIEHLPRADGTPPAPPSSTRKKPSRHKRLKLLE